LNWVVESFAILAAPFLLHFLSREGVDLDSLAVCCGDINVAKLGFDLMYAGLHELVLAQFYSDSVEYTSANCITHHHLVLVIVLFNGVCNIKIRLKTHQKNDDFNAKISEKNPETVGAAPP